MKVTRPPIRSPRRSASSSDSRTLAIGPARDSRSAASRASATSVSSIRRSICRRTVVANSVPATASAMTDAASAATKNFAWKVARKSGGMRSGGWRRIGELVAELLDGQQAVGEDRQLFPQPADVDVDGPRAAGVAVAPDVGEQHVARQHASAMLQHVLEQQEFLRGER